MTRKNRKNVQVPFTKAHISSAHKTRHQNTCRENRNDDKIKIDTKHHQLSPSKSRGANAFLFFPLSKGCLNTLTLDSRSSNVYWSKFVLSYLADADVTAGGTNQSNTASSVKNDIQRCTSLKSVTNCLNWTKLNNICFSNFRKRKFVQKEATAVNHKTRYEKIFDKLWKAFAMMAKTSHNYRHYVTDWTIDWLLDCILPCKLIQGAVITK